MCNQHRTGDRGHDGANAGMPPRIARAQLRHASHRMRRVCLNSGAGQGSPGVAQLAEFGVQPPHGDPLGVPARQALGLCLHMGEHVSQHGVQNQDEPPDEPVPGVLVMGLLGGHGGHVAPGLLLP